MISKAKSQSRQTESTQTAPQTVRAIDDAVVASLSQDDIAGRAYEIYLRSGMVSGRCTQNWHQAEYELRRQRIREALMAEPATVEENDERYSEILNGRNPRADAKLMSAAADTKPESGAREPSKAQPHAPRSEPAHASGGPRAGGLNRSATALTVGQLLSQAASASQQHQQT